MSDPAASASPWRARSGAVPLAAWRDAERAVANGALAATATAWQRAWGLQGALPHAGGDDARHGAARPQLLGGSAAGRAWIGWPDDFDARLGDALWGSGPCGTPVALAVQAACRADLLARLCATLRLEPVPAGAQAAPVPAGSWSGTVEARLPGGVRVLLDADAVRTLLAATGSGAAPAAPPPGALVPVTQALATVAVPLRVHLADCELDVGSLRELQVGDIVPLRHPLGAPLQVRDGAGRPLFGAFLARRRDCKAVQLASLPAASAAADEKVHP